MSVAFPRRLLLCLPLLSACADDAPLRRDFPPIDYGYLPKLRLNVGEIAAAPLPAPGPLDGQNPAPPGPALLRMGQDRLGAGGSSGRALFVVDEAIIARSRDGLEGTLAVHLDVLTSEGARVGFAEARVSRRSVGVGRDLRAALYDMTRLMLDDMNVELEFQLRQSLRDWLQDASPAPTPAPVERQELSTPRS